MWRADKWVCGGWICIRFPERNNELKYVVPGGYGGLIGGCGRLIGGRVEAYRWVDE